MKWTMMRPSFWPEPRDPWAWQRTLRHLQAVAVVPDPRPCWRTHLRGTLSRRAVPGLYGLRDAPAPATVLGVGLLEHRADGWHLSAVGRALCDLDHADFQTRLAEVLVRQSAWLRLALIGLSNGQWRFPRGTELLSTGRPLRLSETLHIEDDALARLPSCERLLGDLYRTDVDSVVTAAPVASLSALHAPLYLLRAQGWLSDAGHPQLPDELAASLAFESPAVALRRIAAEEVDSSGFVPLERVAERLRAHLFSRVSGPLSGTHATSRDDLAAWVDRVIGGAIETGTIEVHAWAPGQPRHGRGLHGDRDRKLVRWTVHDDLQLPASAGRGNQAGAKHIDRPPDRQIDRQID